MEKPEKNDNLSICWTSHRAVIPRWGRNTLAQLVPMVAEDEQFKAALPAPGAISNTPSSIRRPTPPSTPCVRARPRARAAMAENSDTKVSIGLKTITDKSTRNLAEMLTQGSGMAWWTCIKFPEGLPPTPRRGRQRLMQKLQDL